MADRDQVFVDIVTETKKSVKSLAMYTAGITAAYLAVKKMLRVVGDLKDAYAVQERSERKLQAALKATNYAVGISFTQMKRFATQMQKTTGIGDELILGAQGLMTTFTKIGKNVFPDAIKAAADMSVMFGQDLEQSVISLGTALNDPIVGVGRLRRIGISFTEDQKKMIAGFVEANDIMSAQKVILDELSVEFGGVAEAIMVGPVGALEMLTGQLNDLKEKGGRALLEFYEPAIQGFLDLTESINDTLTAKEALNAALSGTGTDYETAIEIQEVRRREAQQNYAKFKAEMTEVYGGIPAGYADEQNRLLNEISAEASKLYWLQEQKDAQDAILVAREKAAELAAEEEATRKAHEKDLENLAEAFAKTDEGQIAALESSIAYFESFEQVGRVIPILEYLREQLRAINETATDTADIFSGQFSNLGASPYGDGRGSGLGQKYNPTPGDERTRRLKTSPYGAGLGSDLGERYRKGAAAAEEYVAVVDKIRSAGEKLLAIEQERGLLAEGEKLRIELLTEEQKAVELLTVEYTKWFMVAGDIFEELGQAMAKGEDLWEAFADAASAAFVAVLQGLGAEMAALAAKNLVLALAGDFTKWPAVAAAGLGSAAAYTSAGVIGAMAEGGIVDKPTVALIGEAGPEAVVPLGRGGGMGTTIIVNVAGTVSSERRLENVIAGVIGRTRRGY